MRRNNQYVKKTYRVLECRGLVRIDFMLDNNNEPYVMEVNTLPGMTETCLVPDAAKALGLDFDDVVKIIINSII